MIGERTTEGFEIHLRPKGGGRWFAAAFLAVWLCGWAAGEAFALWILVKGAIALFTGQPPDPGREPLAWAVAIPVALFLLLWLTLWTIGGIAAAHALLSLTWANDRLVALGGRLRVTASRGPFRSTREYEREQIRRLAVGGRDDALWIEGPRGRTQLSALGTRGERREALAALKAELALSEESPGAPAIPPAWEIAVTPEGERALVPNVATRRTQAQVASAATLLLAGLTLLAAWGAARDPAALVPAFILFAFTAGGAAGTLWLARGRWEWRLGNGALTLRKRWGGDVRDVREVRRLVLDVSKDDDGDEWFELYAPGLSEPVPPAKPPLIRSVPRDRRSVVRVMNDAGAVRGLAAWLALETGIAVDDRTSPAARAAELADLRAMLESSGRLGKWAGKLVDRMEERAKEAG